jgi:exonuclease VII large subunit
VLILFSFPVLTVAAQDGGAVQSGGQLRAQLQQLKTTILHEEYSVGQSDIEQLQQLIEKVSQEENEDLLAEAKMTLVLAEEKQRREEQKAVPEEEQSRQQVSLLPGYHTGTAGINLTGVGMGVGTSFASLALFNVFSTLGNSVFERYINTSSTSTAALLQHRLKLYDSLSYVFLGTSVLGMGISIPFILAAEGGKPPAEELPGEEELKRQAARDQKQLERLQSRLDRSYKSSRGWTTVAGVSLGTGLATIIGSGLSLAISEVFFNAYIEANYSRDEEQLGIELDILQYCTLGTGVAAATGLTAAALVGLLKPEPLSIQRDVARLHTSLMRNPHARVATEEYRQYLEAQIQQLQLERDALAEKLAHAEKYEKQYSGGFWSFFGLGVASLVGTGLSLYFTDVSFDAYNAASGEDETERLRKEYLSAKTLSFVGAGVSGVSLSVAAFIQVLRPHPEPIKKELQQVEQRLRLFRERLSQ